MNETLDFLDRQARVTADVVEATIIGPSADGMYEVELIGSRGKLLASTNLGEFFANGSRVLVQMPSNSRNVIGTMPVITSRAPKEQRGLSLTTPAETRDYFDQASVTGLDPDPLVLVAGGDAGEQIITGHGLIVGAEYLGQGLAAPPPLLSDAIPPAVTPTKVTLTLAADADSPLGDFDLTIAGKKVRGALKIVPPADGEPLIGVLWALGWDLSYDFNILLRIASASMEIAAATSIPGLSTTGIVLVNGTAYVRSSQAMHRISDSGAVAETYPITPDSSAEMQDAVYGDLILYGDPATGNTLYAFDTSSETETSWNLGVPVSPFSRMHIWIHGDVAVITNGSRVITWDLLTSTLIDSAPFGTVIEVCTGTIADVPFIYVLRNGGGDRTLSKIDFTTLAEVDSVDVGPNGDVGHSQLIPFGGYVYGTNTSPASNIAFAVNVAAMSIVTVELGVDIVPHGLDVTNDFVLVALNDFSGGTVATNVGGVLRIDRATMEVVRLDSYPDVVHEIGRVKFTEE